MNTVGFWQEVADRAIKSAIQVVLLAVGGDAVFDIFTVDLKALAGIALSAAVLSVLTSIASAPIGKTDSPSVLGQSGQKGPSPAVWR